MYWSKRFLRGGAGFRLHLGAPPGDIRRRGAVRSAIRNDRRMRRPRLKFRGEEPAAVAETRSGIRTDLRIRPGCGRPRCHRMQRVFPPAGRFEERTRREGLHRWYDVWFDSVTPVTRAAGDFSQLPGVERVEPVYTTRPIGFSGTAVPAAPRPLPRGSLSVRRSRLALQWHYDNDGTLTDAVAGADINLFRAWEVTSGAPEVVGGGGRHRLPARRPVGQCGNRAELTDRRVWTTATAMWTTSTAELHLFIGQLPYGSNKTPGEHGTHVAGTIGAENNNGKGSAAWPEAAEAIRACASSAARCSPRTRATTATK